MRRTPEPAKKAGQAGAPSVHSEEVPEEKDIMKKVSLLFAALVLAAAVRPAPVAAHEWDADDSDHPLRLVGYVGHPIGLAAEYIILRPIHMLVSMNKCTNLIFGHESVEKDWHPLHFRKATVSVMPEGTTPEQATAAAVENPDGTRPEYHASDLITIYFDYDKHDIRPDQMEAAEKNLKTLKENPNLQILIEGHCDERGTNEYNFALGERRAKAVRDYLEQNGIDPARMHMVSRGEESPAAQGHDESAWKQNRRAEFKDNK